MLSPQVSAELGFVIDLGQEIRPGVELAIDGRVLTSGAQPSPSMGGVARVGWRSHLGLTAAAAARGGVATTWFGCAGSTHIVNTGVEGEVGVEVAKGGPVLVTGLDFPLGSAWLFGASFTTHIDVRWHHGLDAVRVGHDAGLALVYPDCGWEFL